MNDIHSNFAQQGLIRPRTDRVLGGVCAGLGRRFGLAPWPARLLFVLILMVIPGSQILIYPILWILMPSEESLYPSYPGPEGYQGYQGYPAPQAPPQQDASAQPATTPSAGTD